MATSTTKPAGNPAKKEAPKDGATNAATNAATKAAPASGDRRMMAMIAAFAILSAGASAGAVFMVTRTQINVVPTGGHAGSQREYPGPTYALGDFIVNLGSVDSRRFLKAQVALGFAAYSDEFATLKGSERDSYLNGFNEEMKLREARIKDTVNMTLAGFSAAELGTVQGRQQLKTSLIAKLDRLMPPAYRINDVYFPEFIIQ